MINENAPAPAATGREGLMPEEGTDMNLHNVPRTADIRVITVPVPEWAQQARFEENAVWFSRTVGAVDIDAAYNIETGTVLSPAAISTGDATEDLTAAEAIRLAADLIEAGYLLCPPAGGDSQIGMGVTS